VHREKRKKRRPWRTDAPSLNPFFTEKVVGKGTRTGALIQWRPVPPPLIVSSGEVSFVAVVPRVASARWSGPGQADAHGCDSRESRW